MPTATLDQIEGPVLQTATPDEIAGPVLRTASPSEIAGPASTSPASAPAESLWDKVVDYFKGAHIASPEEFQARKNVEAQQDIPALTSELPGAKRAFGALAELTGSPHYAENPVTDEFVNTVASQVTPLNVGLAIGTAGLSGIAGRLLAAGFGGQAAYQGAKQFQRYQTTDDPEEKQRLLVDMSASGVFAALGGLGALGPREAAISTERGVLKDLGAETPPRIATPDQIESVVQPAPDSRIEAEFGLNLPPDTSAPLPPKPVERVAEPVPTPEARQAPENAVAGQVDTGNGIPMEAQGPISTKNAYTEAQIEQRGLKPAEQEAARDFGAVWDEARATDVRDPQAGTRLIEAIDAGKVKALDDHDNALLLNEQIKAQAEHTDAVDAVNEAPTEENKIRLNIARDRLQAVYDADRAAGTATGRGLNARKMLAQDDYSLAAMEARKRAANNGQPLTDKQIGVVQLLHDKIAELSSQLDKVQATSEKFGGFRKTVRPEARAAQASGKRLVDFLTDQEQRAKARLIAKRGRLNVGIDPTNIIDEAIIGAAHIARGLTKFSDWSAAMLKDFGERIRPFLKDIWDKARAYHSEASRAFKTLEQSKLEAYKTRLAGETVGVTAKIERGDFTNVRREQMKLDRAAYQMKANLQRLKNEFERGVAMDAYKNMTPADKFWQHFIGVERAMKLSSPAVFEKLGLAAAAREVLAPAETAVGYVTSKVFPRLAEGTRYGASLGAITKAEIKAKAAIFTQGMRDAWANVKGKETTLEAMSDKYGRQPDFWYNRIGKIHAAIKAPIKRAEFVRSLESRMDAATRGGEDINEPQVMDRLAHEAALDANRAIFQQNTVVSRFFSMLDKASPAGGRAARFLFPVVKIPVNLFKELLTYNLGAPTALARIGHAYLNGIENSPPLAREAMIRQLVKGSVGGAALLWGYYHSDSVRRFFAGLPTFFGHTPLAMAIEEGAIIKALENNPKSYQARKEAGNMVKYDIPFMYTVTGLADALDPKDPNGWKKYLYGMIQGTVIPTGVSWTAKEMDKPTPFSQIERFPRYRPPNSVKQALEADIPGLRQNVPIKPIRGR